eukprot:3112613-Pyramimonas_sp.AAC.1
MLSGRRGCAASASCAKVSAGVTSLHQVGCFSAVSTALAMAICLRSLAACRAEVTFAHRASHT